MNAHRIVAALLALALCAAPATAAITQQTFAINAGGLYRYLPSPFVPIPGGMPSDYQLDFGIGGTFVYEFDTTVPQARLLNLNLFLTGNEAIQASPPPVAPVTADRVETYLASHTFVTDFIGGLVHLESSVHPNLKLTDSLSGSVFIVGGYDLRLIDGDGVHFQFGAQAVPESAGFALVGAAALVIVRQTRKPRGDEVDPTAGRPPSALRIPASSARVR